MAWADLSSPIGILHPILMLTSWLGFVQLTNQPQVIGATQGLLKWFPNIQNGIPASIILWRPNNWEWVKGACAEWNAMGF